MTIHRYDISGTYDAGVEIEDAADGEWVLWSDVQAFFSEEDIDVLVRGAGFLERSGLPHTSLLRAIASKIDALLPPKENIDTSGR